MQPLLKVRLINEDAKNECVIVNENHVAYVKPHPKGYAILVMSTGEELVVAEPRFVEWEGDCYIRKE